MKQEELNQVLEKHAKWLNDITCGTRANLIRADLSDADLSGANLMRADLSGADLYEVDLSGAKLN